MVRPNLGSRIEDGNVAPRRRIGNELSRALAKRTGDARQGEIGFDGLPACGLWINVVDVKGRFLPCVGEATILALLAGPCNDGASQRRRGCRSSGRPLRPQPQEGQQVG